jgi:hypothetical protein
MQDWGNNSVHSVSLTPIPSGSTLPATIALDINTNFGGGIGGDNWDIAAVSLTATVLS